MFHIIFLSPHSDPQAEMGELDSGGQCIYEHQLALALSEQPEFRVTTFCRQTGKRPDESIVNNSYKIIRIHSGEQKPVRKEELEREMDEFVTKVSTYLTEYERSDTIILHGHYWDGGYAALGLKSRWKYKLPFVWTPHSLGSLKRRKFMGIEHELFYQFVPRQCWESYSMHIADRVVLSTQKEKQSVLDDYGIDEQKIVITPPGVDIQSLQKIDQQEAREKWRLPTDGKIILSIGRMVRNKAYHLGILAFEELLKKFHEPVYLAIFGGSQHSSVDEEIKYRHELQQLIRERNLLSRVFLYPAVAHEQINEVFSAGDLFLMSSMYEPFGIVTIEAMAMGLPVVAANSGGSVNIITHNQTGILTDFQDPHRVATYLFSLLRDEDTYERIAKAALRQAKRNYDWTEKSAQFAAQYRQISRREESEFFQKVIKHNYFLQQHFSI